MLCVHNQTHGWQGTHLKMGAECEFIHSHLLLLHTAQHPSCEGHTRIGWITHLCCRLGSIPSRHACFKSVERMKSHTHQRTPTLVSSFVTRAPSPYEPIYKWQWKSHKEEEKPYKIRGQETCKVLICSTIQKD